jgi:pyruvate/2-oxoglutarate dehydrogenase complex dihydrolipoamide dehydrogenase (E3) component
MPGASPLHAKLIFARDSGRVLGGQIVGQRGAGKRIDVVATAVTYGLTLQQLVDADLAYAPPFSPVWDPVQTAARAALQDQSRGSGAA